MQITKKYIKADAKELVIGGKQVSVTFFPDQKRFMISIGTKNTTGGYMLSDNTYMWIDEANYASVMDAIRQLTASYDGDYEYKAEFNNKTITLRKWDNNVFIHYWGEVTGTSLCIPESILKEVVDFLSSSGPDGKTCKCGCICK